MPMTMTEKILARASGREEVGPGDLVLAKVDFAMGHDLTIPHAGRIMREQMGATRVWDQERVAVVQDHFQPAKDVASAGLGRLTREFAREMGVKWYFEVGQGGICHTVLPERGLVLPGELVVGADSHSCTYGALNNFAAGVGSTDLACVLSLGELWFRVPETLRFVYHNRLSEWVEAKDLILHVIGQITVDGARSKAMEHSGEAISQIDMEGRLTMTNMAIEAGAKNGIIGYDEVTEAYLRGRAKRSYSPVAADPDAIYERTFEFDAEAVPITLAKPMSPDHAASIDEVAGTKLDQVFIGSCTNSRIGDLRRAAAVLRGRKVAPWTRLIVTPSSHQVAQAAEREGLIGVFLEAGAAWTASTCGACLGGHQGVLGPGEVCLSTSNRNFPGRMGDPKALVYLSNPVVAAASAVTGEITHPKEVVGKELVLA
ncbi:MAG: 3-isopropylmalate dehydratase large subunit [Candidatus Dormibacteraeota bacterium]|uniref:3-isopropylmalate dehydratase large subunit n=1 Tax=Candidatus Dormiibacter inghamiae TaxID=3127013 RepID=A0A934K8I6_9BACT|nr:3-isopropylmalate dehydratase large subunit [Candidatus Dormibacteraeota bacterium]MBJ7607261.1 3-isopropylmalate dehydratase large subunit [Candidatus Dormibacteraeota bacterium]